MANENQNLSPAAVLENELWERMTRQHDEDRLYADLTGFYAEIIRAIGKTDKSKATIIYDYAALLEQELQLYSSADAYIAGAKSCVGACADDVVYCYVREVSLKNSTLGLDAKILTLYSEIGHLLGGSGGMGLIDEFTQIYRRVHGTVRNNIRDFVCLGQNAGTEGAVMA